MSSILGGFYCHNDVMQSTTQKLYTLALCFVAWLWCGSHSAVAGAMISGSVKDVAADGQMTLHDGTAMTMADWVFPARDISELAARVKGQKIQCQPVDTDRYGRAVCYLFDEQQTPIAAGPQAMAYSDKRYEHTQQALQQDRSSHFIIPSQEAENYLEHYAAVQGEVMSVTARRGGAYLNFGPDYKTDFTISVFGKAYKGRTPQAWKALAGKKVIVRGWISRYNGPHIALLNPDMLYVVASPKNAH